MNFLYTIYKRKEYINLSIYTFQQQSAKNYIQQKYHQNIQPSDSKEGKTKTTKKQKLYNKSKKKVSVAKLEKNCTASNYKNTYPKNYFTHNTIY